MPHRLPTKKAASRQVLHHQPRRLAQNCVRSPSGSRVLFGVLGVVVFERDGTSLLEAVRADGVADALVVGLEWGLLGVAVVDVAGDGASVAACPAGCVGAPTQTLPPPPTCYFLVNDAWSLPAPLKGGRPGTVPSVSGCKVGLRTRERESNGSVRTREGGGVGMLGPTRGGGWLCWSSFSVSEVHQGVAVPTPRGRAAAAHGDSSSDTLCLPQGLRCTVSVPCALCRPYLTSQARRMGVHNGPRQQQDKKSIRPHV